MRREAARTLHSLSRRVPGGHRRPQLRGHRRRERLRRGPEARRRVRGGFGPEFRYLDLGAEAEPSPVMALNRGIRAGRGRAFALMIDGAHVLTPGVLRFGLAGLATYAPAIVATQQWYVGPGQQGDAMDDGYDQDYEDRLFDRRSAGPTRVTGCSRSGTSSATATGSTACGRATACSSRGRCSQQVGCFDESFSDGRVAATPTSSSTSGSARRPTSRCARSSARGPSTRCTAAPRPTSPTPPSGGPGCSATASSTRELRGRPFKGPGKPIHYVGRTPEHRPLAARSRAGCRPTAFAEALGRRLHDGRPRAAHPACPTSSRGRSRRPCGAACRGRSTTWLGEPRHEPRRPTSSPTRR